MDGVSRRLFLQGLIGLGASTCFVMPGLALAQARTNKRLVIVIMRGGMDGLAAVVPYGDRDYTSLRGDMALNGDVLLKLDEFYAFHKALEPLHTMYRARELLAVHAVASPYRERSHFDAQNVLELGSTRPNELKSGWLNRVVAAINEKDSKLGMAIGQNTPLILRGPQNATSWAPSVLPEVGENYYALVEKVYAKDPLFSKALTEGLEIQEKGAELFHAQTGGRQQRMARQARSRQAFVTMAEAAGKWLATPDGPRLATLEIDGWDTHANQGVEGGPLASNFTLFANGLENLKKALGPAWRDTVVVAMTEFGRTARPNGNRGTDHGTAGAMFIAGGAVDGGRVISRWPGLATADLYQARDLKPTTDIRAVMKGVLNDHYGLSAATLSHDIYPGSSGVAPMRGLLKG